MGDGLQWKRWLLLREDWVHTEIAWLHAAGLASGDFVFEIFSLL